MIELLKKYEEVARETFREAFVSKENVMEHAQKAGLDEENKARIAAFMDYADMELKQFIWLYYYIQFESEEDFSQNIWQLGAIPLPPDAEEKFPGYINAVVYLLAAENLKKWLEERELPLSMLELYYDRYRNIVSLNQISHDTYGFCRLSPFLYGYTRPFQFWLGSLIYQYTPYKDYSEMYEDASGNRVFVALPNYKYNEEGLRDPNGTVPAYEQREFEVIGHVFDEKGRLTPEPVKLDTRIYKKILAPGDNVITIHIPEGRKLHMDGVKASIKEAGEFFRKYFPPIKAIVCYTWFIDPGLRGKVIKPGSNMWAFGDLFDIICANDNENHSVYEHVFMVKRQPLENLVPKNDFQKRVLEHALEGGKIYWSYGVLKKDIDY